MNEQFHFTAKNGDEIVIPHINKIKGGLLRKYRKQDELDMMLSILEDIATEEALAKFDDLDKDEVDDFFTKWQKAGASVGKSSGSST